MRFVTLILMLAGALLGCEKSAPVSSEPAEEESTEPPEEKLFEVLALAEPESDGRVDELLLEAQRAARANPRSADVWVEVGRAWVRKARNDYDDSLYDNAEAAAQRALLVDEDNRAALNVRGLALLNAHRFADARRVAERVLELDSDDPMALGTLSDAALELGEYEAATDAVQKMLDLKPNLPSYARAAHLKWLHGENAAAKQLYRLAHDAGRGQRDREPGAWVLVEAAEIFRFEGDYEGAIAGYDKALERVPDYPPALAGKALALMSLGRHDEAVPLARKAAVEEQTVENLTVRYHAARRAGADEASLEEIEERIVEAGTDDPLALSRFLAETDPDEAARLAGAERKTRPKNIHVQGAYAWALHHAGQTEEARKWSEEATRLGTKDPALLYRAAVIELASGDEEAETRIDELVENHGLFDPTLRHDPDGA